MNVQTYLERRQARIKQEAQFRIICMDCRQPEFTCYCQYVKPFDCQIKFVILIHHLEFRRRIATGRLAHLCLEGSELIRGYNYTDNARVNQLLADPQYHCTILYPGPMSTNLTDLSTEQRRQVTPPGKKILIFVIDGTWSTAKKMLRHSLNLHNLPRICFTPAQPSRFRVRKQPKELCYSSVEAIHHTIELVGPSQGYHLEEAKHNNLLQVFDKMVEQQLEFIERSHRVRPFSRHRSKSHQNCETSR